MLGIQVIRESIFRITTSRVALSQSHRPVTTLQAPIRMRRSTLLMSTSITFSVNYFMGNTSLTTSAISNSEFDHSNGDCVSVGGGWVFQDNDCHDVSANGFENSPGSFPQIYRRNRLRNVRLDGIAVTNLAYNLYLNQRYAPITIDDNHLSQIGRNGVVLFDTFHVSITNNLFVDCITGISLYDFGDFRIASQLPSSLTSRSRDAVASSVSQPQSLAPLSSPSQKPTLLARRGGYLDRGIYRVATAWVTSTESNDVVSPIGVQNTINLDTDGSQIDVSQPGPVPPNVRGYLVFLTIGPSTVVIPPDTGAVAQPTQHTVISAIPKRSIILPLNSRGYVLSPNIQDITVTGNTFVSDTQTVSAAIKCCGTPLVSPWIRDATIRNNGGYMTPRGAAAHKQIQMMLAMPAAPSEPLSNHLIRSIIEQNSMKPATADILDKINTR